jgi:hypothetical protein
MIISYKLVLTGTCEGKGSIMVYFLKLKRVVWSVEEWFM